MDLSFVVPAYNEEERLPEMLRTHINYVKRVQKSGKLPPRCEFIIIDDGSKDKTWEIILNATKKYNDPSSGVVVRGLKQF